jgi:hypothetical protein
MARGRVSQPFSLDSSTRMGRPDGRVVVVRHGAEERPGSTGQGGG